jgi:3',5'-cyclic AMP phosphodiesterase CpdA
VLIGQISDVHVGGGRSRQELLRTAIDEINAAEPDLVVVAGDLTDDGYPDQYPLGYPRFEDTFGARDSRLRLELPEGAARDGRPVPA